MNVRLKHETITAARYTLRHPLIPAWCAEIDLITASDLLALLTYHKKCGIAVQTLWDFNWIKNHYRSQSGCKWLFYSGNCRCGRNDDRRFFLWGDVTVTWWITYMQGVFELLKDSPSGDTVRTAADRTVEMVRASNCAVCPGQVKENMAEFSNLLAQKVEEIVDKIELEMDF